MEKGDGMVKLYDKASGNFLGEITDAEFKFLIDQLEEESEADDDYYLDRGTLDFLKEKGMDEALTALLEGALGANDSVEIRYEKSGTGS